MASENPIERFMELMEEFDKYGDNAETYVQNFMMPTLGKALTKMIEIHNEMVKIEGIVRPLAPEEFRIRFQNTLDTNRMVINKYIEKCGPFPPSNAEDIQ